MKRTLLTIMTLLSFINLYSQISCNPSIGNNFEPIAIGTNFRENPDLNSKIIYKITNTDDEFFECIEDGFANDFVKLRIGFTQDYLEKNGLKKNLIKLYFHFKDSLKYDITLKEFVKSVKDENTVKNYYNTIINPEDTATLKYWSTYEDEYLYDVSTIESFKKSYLNFNITPLGEKIIECFHSIGYVNKSQLRKYYSPMLFFYNEDTSENRLNEIKQSLELKENNYCDYDERVLFSNFSHYILALVKEEKPFLGLQEINKYSNYFNTREFKQTIYLLKMYCSYYDKNYSSTILVAKDIIDLYKKKIIISFNYNYGYSIVNGRINISMIYQILIDSLIKTESPLLAYQYSKECLANKDLQYEGYLLNHGIILYNQNKKNEACKIWNQEYLDGNEAAKNLLEEYCK